MKLKYETPVMDVVGSAKFEDVLTCDYNTQIIDGITYYRRPGCTGFYKSFNKIKWTGPSEYVFTAEPTSGV